MFCDEAKLFLIEHLESDIAAHERGDYARIGEAEKFLPSFTNSTGKDEEEEERLSVASNYWSWLDGCAQPRLGLPSRRRAR